MLYLLILEFFKLKMQLKIILVAEQGDFEPKIVEFR